MSVFTSGQLDDLNALSIPHNQMHSQHVALGVWTPLPTHFLRATNSHKFMSTCTRHDMLSKDHDIITRENRCGTRWAPRSP
jgi:hypothetical protein